MKIVTVIGARPQFIKAAAVSRAIRNNYASELQEVLVHTGQHYDANMSKVFFDELDIPAPAYNLEISGGSHGSMTGKMLEAIEHVLINEKPDYLLIYGDTNSTLAGALAAAKLHIPIAHIEAGLRSFNMKMPEEINRIVSDRLATLLFCPTEAGIKNLRSEGIVRGVSNVGDVMYDVALFYGDKAQKASQILTSLGLERAQYVLATCHRAENTDDPERLREILLALKKIAARMPVVFPLHPRTSKLIDDYGFSQLIETLHLTEPLPFLDMIALERSARLILTDSGGVQKEAFFYAVSCLTMREETEWVETVELGCNRLVGASTEQIFQAFEDLADRTMTLPTISPYGDGMASQKIIERLLETNIH